MAPNMGKMVVITPKGRIVKITRLYEGEVVVLSEGDESIEVQYSNRKKQVARFAQPAFARHVPASTGGKDHSRKE